MVTAQRQASSDTRKLRLINPRSGLSTLTMPEIIRKMTFWRRGLFMPLNLVICAAVVPASGQPRRQQKGAQLT